MKTVKNSKPSIQSSNIFSTKEIFLKCIKKKEMKEQKALLDFYMEVLKELDK